MRGAQFQIPNNVSALLWRYRFHRASAEILHAKLLVRQLSDVIPPLEACRPTLSRRRGFETYASALRKANGPFAGDGSRSGRRCFQASIFHPDCAAVARRRWAPGVTNIIMDGTAPAKVLSRHQDHKVAGA